MKQRGFTLIEVMISVVIVGILLAIAIPNYSDYVKRGARTEAKTALLDIANKQEQFYVDNHQYTATLSNLGVAATSETGLYSISVTTASSDTEFTVTATASSGIALKDDECKTFTITQTGAKGYTGSGPCW